MRVRGETIGAEWSMDQTWNRDSLWVIAFVQSTLVEADTTRELYQAASVKLNDMPMPVIRHAGSEAQAIAPLQLQALGTEIRFTLQTPQYVTLRLFDLHGRTMLTLLQGNQPFGGRKVPLTRGLSGGIYVCRLTAGQHSQAVPISLAR